MSLPVCSPVASKMSSYLRIMILYLPVFLGVIPRRREVPNLVVKNKIILGIPFADCTGLQRELKHETFLEELVFWTVKYEFPQKVVCFLLNMLPDVKYKVRHQVVLSFIVITNGEHR